MIFTNNSYNILGLSIDADDNLINKRYKEISQYLRMDEVPEYDTDVQGLKYSNIRTQENVSAAYNILSHQTKKIDAMFFWMTLMDDVDSKSHTLLSQWDLYGAINHRKIAFYRTRKFYHLKNKIISCLIALENPSIYNGSIWKDFYREIINDISVLLSSEVFWKEFIQIYNLNNDVPIKKWYIEKYRWELEQKLAEDFFDIAEIIWDSDIYKLFVDEFGFTAKELDDNKNVTDAYKILEKAEKDIDTLVNDYSYTKAQEAINFFANSLETLKEIWLDRDPKYRIKIDSVWKKLRWLAIDLQSSDWNKEAAKLMWLIKILDLWDQLREKVESDETELIKMHQDTELLNPLLELFKKAGENGGTHQWKATGQYVLNNYIKFWIQEKYIDDVKVKVGSWLNYAKYNDNPWMYIKRMRDEVLDWEWIYWTLNNDQRVVLVIYFDSILNVAAKRMTGNSSYSNSEDSNYWWIIRLILLIWFLANVL